MSAALVPVTSKHGSVSTASRTTRTTRVRDGFAAIGEDAWDAGHLPAGHVRRRSAVMGLRRPGRRLEQRPASDRVADRAPVRDLDRQAAAGQNELFTCEP